jgi:hypothetical protein
MPHATFHNKCFNLAWIFNPQMKVQASMDKGEDLPPNERESSCAKITEKIS